jgi:non-heme chloroperoxidase
MNGGIKAHYDCIKAFSETDFTEDLKSVDFPVLILHGEDDQIVPYNVTALRAIKLVKNGKIITYPGLCHGIPTTDADRVNADILNFIKS